MWWSRPVLLMLVLALGPAGCGFHPMYGAPTAGPSAVSGAMELIRVDPIDQRTGQMLRTEMISLLSPRGEPATPSYRLTVKASRSSGGIAQAQTGLATLGELTVTASFSLHEYTGGKALFSGSARSITTFRYYGPRYGSIATEREAEERALKDIAADIRNQVGAYLSSSRAGYKPGLEQ